VRGRRYRYEYNVNFTNAAQDIGFGMLIKTTAGLELGGATTLHDNRKRLKSVNAGTKISVCFEFECVFLPGTYFINAGVAGSVTGGVVGDALYLHRRLDALIFRVMAETDRTPTGLVDIKAIATWSDAGSIE
jgi:lipopolysaccharide transport system ATP-binding protein